VSSFSISPPTHARMTTIWRQNDDIAIRKVFEKKEFPTVEGDAIKFNDVLTFRGVVLHPEGVDQ
jgi:molybdopterin biosynthesis enzyme